MALLKISRILVFSLTLSIRLGPARAEASGNGFAKLREAQTVIESLLRKLTPESYQCAYNFINESLRPSSYESAMEVAGANSGLTNHFTDLLNENACFGHTAFRFWKKMVHENEVDDYSDLPSKPNMFERAGEGRFANQKPGWLWLEALRATGDNPRLALTLLSACMHDDLNLKVEVMGQNSEFKPYLENELATIDQKIRKAQRERAHLRSWSDEWRVLQSTLRKLSAKREELKNELDYKGPSHSNCPRGSSSIFAPQAVASQLDLPIGLKGRIKALQYPNGGNPPAKAYHFMGAAYIGCNLARCGLSVAKAGQIASTIAAGYRAIRLCSQLAEELENIEILERKLGVRAESREFQQAAMALSRPDQATVRQVKRDATLLYAHVHHVGSDSVFRSCVLSHTLIPGKSRSSRITVADPRHMMVDPCSIFNGDRERCKAAQNLIRSWEIDFEWTQTQHRIGAEWGRQICDGQDFGKTLSQLQCPHEHPQPQTTPQIRVE